MAKWILTKEGERFTIRESKGKRYPRYKYASLTSQRELEDLVIRLNGKDPVEERARAAAIFRHAYISPALLDDYRELLESRIPTKKDAKTKFTYLMHTLNYFVETLNIQDPLDWHKKQHIWSKHLQESEYSAKVLREIVYELNRFMVFLHEQRPEEVPPLKFNPLSRAVLKLQEAKREKRKSLYIPDEDWEKLLLFLAQTPIWPNALLAYNYGLRRNETMGLTADDVFVQYLNLERQWKGNPLKSRDQRKIPHWFGSPKEAYELIERLPDLHPDTITQIFSRVCEDIELPAYVFHDIRRTFITRCIRKGIPAADLRLAVGHTSLETTSKFYLMDDRELKKVPYKPKAS